MLQLSRQQQQAENAQMAMTGGSSNGNGGNSPPQLVSSRLSSSMNTGMTSSSQGHGSPPQGVIGPPGMNAGNNSGSYLSQSQNQPTRPHSPLLTGRPSSAPSVQPGKNLFLAHYAGNYGIVLWLLYIFIFFFFCVCNIFCLFQHNIYLF